MSILCKHREIDGADLIRLMVRAQERREKMAKFEQEIERPAEPVKLTFLDRILSILKGISVLGVIYLLVRITIGLVR